MARNDRKGYTTERSSKFLICWKLIAFCACRFKNNSNNNKPFTLTCCVSWVPNQHTKSTSQANIT